MPSMALGDSYLHDTPTPGGVDGSPGAQLDDLPQIRTVSVQDAALGRHGPGNTAK